MRSVYLVGTAHHYQRGAAFNVSEETFEEFRVQLRQFITQYGIRGIAEEMNIDGMWLFRSRGGSLGFCLAQELALPHAYCDPDRPTRAARGIVSLADRERYWLDELSRFSAFPCLFILGADHVDSFSALLETAGYESMVLVRDWQPVLHAEV